MGLQNVERPRKQSYEWILMAICTNIKMSTVCVLMTNAYKLLYCILHFCYFCNVDFFKRNLEKLDFIILHNVEFKHCFLHFYNLGIIWCKNKLCMYKK